MHAKHEVVLECAQREQDGPEQGAGPIIPAIAIVMIILRCISILTEAGYVLRLLPGSRRIHARLYRQRYRFFPPQPLP
jgi:hypothetical protein